MTGILMGWESWSWLGAVVLDTAGKNSALLLTALLVTGLLRRDSAASRHLIWVATIVLVLLMPWLSAGLPAWQVLPTWLQARQTTVWIPTVPADTEWPAPASHPLPPAVRRGTADSSSPLLDGTQPIVGALRSSDSTGSSGPQVASAATAGTMGVRSAANVWQTRLGGSWLIGFLVCLSRLALARWVLRRSGRGCQEVGRTAVYGMPVEVTSHDRTQALQTAFELAKRRLGVGRAVRLLLDRRDSMPVVWGLWRPRLRLPAVAIQWSAPQQLSVLMHEVAHLRRHDLVTLLIVQLTCALNWFNPLVWLAAWRLHVEQERACDDLVLSAGVRPSQYAEHLLQLASQSPTSRWAISGGLAMARRSSFAGRLEAVLDRDINRRAATWSIGALALVGAAVVGLPLAMLTAAEPPSASGGQAPAAAAAAADAAAEPPAADPQVARLVERLQWGESVNGLRAALARPQAFGNEDAGEVFDFQLVLQNVSDTPIRLSAKSAEQKSTRLVLRRQGVTLAAFSDPQPPLKDMVLRPREISVLKLVSDRTRGSTVAKDDPDQGFVGELAIENGPEGSWSGKLATGEARATFAAYGLVPKDKEARALFIAWHSTVRRSGKIPGGMVGLLGDSVRTFIKNNPTWETTPQLQKMLPRLDPTRDWTGLEALDLLDELALLQATPIRMALDAEATRGLRTGSPLPASLTEAPWGSALPNGLRVAWLVEPRAAAYPLGTGLKARIYIHNSGREPVVFRTRGWHQLRHEARTPDGNELTVVSTSWTTLGRLTPIRLAPDEFVELNTTGIGIGANRDDEDWQHSRVGSWIHAQAGDDVLLTTAPIPLSDWNEEPPAPGQPGWWQPFVAARLARFQPLPDDAEERKHLLYRVALDLFGTPLGEAEVAAFVADRGANAVDTLAERLARRPGQIAFTGSLPPATMRFHVQPADPDAAKRPRTAYNPGRYTLREKVILAVTRRPLGERIVNEATVQFTSATPGKGAAMTTHKLPLPDGYDTWAAAWNRGGNTLWVRDASGIKSLDLSNPAELPTRPTSADQVPDAIREALDRTLKAAEKSADPPKKLPPAATKQ